MTQVPMTFEPCDPPEVSLKPRKLTQCDMVLALLKVGWWTPRDLRIAIAEDHFSWVEAVTSRIRELRQRGHEIESETVPGTGGKVWRYRLVAK